MPSSYTGAEAGAGGAGAGAGAGASAGAVGKPAALYVQTFEERCAAQDAHQAVHVSNLVDTVSDDTLRGAFAGFGNIVFAKVVRYGNGVSKGFGFVYFSSAVEASTAIAGMNGQILETEPIYAALSQRQKQQQQQQQQQHQGPRQQQRGNHHQQHHARQPQQQHVGYQQQQFSYGQQSSQQQFGGSDGSGLDRNHGIRPGDWVCPRIVCNSHNFASRAVCRMCQQARPEAAAALPAMCHWDRECTNATCTFRHSTGKCHKDRACTKHPLGQCIYRHSFSG